MIRSLIFTAAILLTVLPVAYGQGDAGLTFLKLGVGARNAAMGETGVAASADAAAAFYNPAALTLTAGTDIHLMHRQWIQDASMQYAAIATSLSHVVLGLHINNVSIDDIEVRSIPGPAISTTSWRDVAIGVSAAIELDDRFSAGISGNFLYEKIYTDDASGYAVSFGGLYRISPVLRAGLSVNNLGSMNALQQSSPDLPTSIRGGAAYDMDLSGMQSRVTGTLELASYRGDELLHVHAGGEFVYHDLLSLRAGIVTGYESRNVTGGLGLLLQGFRFDYAVLPFRYDLGTSHTISIGYIFH